MKPTYEKQYFDRPSQCGKRRYDSKKMAATVVNDQGRRHNGLKLRAYPCPRCKGWHVSSQL